MSDTSCSTSAKDETNAATAETTGKTMEVTLERSVRRVERSLSHSARCVFLDLSLKYLDALFDDIAELARVLFSPSSL